MAVTLAAVPSPPQITATVYYLRHADNAVVVDSLMLKDGEMQVLPQREVVGVILAFGSGGMSGDVSQQAQRTGRIAVLYRGGEIRVKVQRPDGTSRDLPPVKIATLAEVDIRVNVTGGAGYRKAFLVRGYETVEAASGPVIDMFAGKVPLGAGDFAVTTEVVPRAIAPRVTGTAELEFDAGLLFVRGDIAGGGSGWFIVDFGAGATTVDSGMLPPAAEVRELRAVEHSAAGVRELPAVMHGAGGSVPGFLGQAAISRLRIGSMDFADIRVNVVTNLPAFGRPIAGVLGIDLLSRAPRVSIGLGADRVLSLHSEPRQPPAGVAVPFTMAAKHIFVDGSVEGVPARLLFDTGARRTLVPRDVADRAGLVMDRGEVWNVRGLDGNSLQLPSALAGSVNIGPASAGAARIYVGDLPALGAMGLQDASGLLGMDVLGRFEWIEVDFEARVVRFGAHAHPRAAAATP
jgi:predicted aspartyl protease